MANVLSDALLAAQENASRYPLVEIKAGQFSLDTFDAIVLTDSSDLSADGLGVSSGAAFPFRDEQLTYLSCWI